MAEHPDFTGVNMSANQELFLQLYREADSLDQREAQVKDEKKKHRKLLRLNGFNLQVWDHTRKIARLSPDERQLQQSELARNLDWLNLLPEGFQMDMFDDTAESTEIRAASQQGRSFGRTGGSRDDNPHEPGSAAYQAWDLAWFAGSQDLDRRLDAAEGTQQGRGRPRKVYDAGEEDVDVN